MVIPALEHLMGKTKSHIIYTELFSDFHTPISILDKLKKQSEHSFLLESVNETENWGRYSYIGYEPRKSVVVKDGQTYINGETTNKPVEDAIKSELTKYAYTKQTGLPPFTGGFVGYFSYDSIQYFEKAIKMRKPKAYDASDIELLLFDVVIAFDHLKKKIFVMKNILSDNLEQNYREGATEIKVIVDLIQTGYHPKFQPTDIGEFKPNMSKPDYCKKVLKAKQRIREGDIFQVVLSQRFSAPIKGDLFNTYRYLRTINPSPYMFYFISSDIEVAGASPETLVHVVDNNVKTFPIAGTRHRGQTPEEDTALEKELLEDEKELAEHNMLVDLGRNDSGKVCEFGSVNVKDYMKVKRFSKVMHITSLVEGTLTFKRTSLDALKAIIPAGTLSGAPKIMACNIIDELEPTKRGLYGGAIGYINFNLDMDMCITIRTAVKYNDNVHVQAGGGIVNDSDPEAEYNETIYKASAMIEAIKSANKVGM